jgi:hypothetical protein
VSLDRLRGRERLLADPERALHLGAAREDSGAVPPPAPLPADLGREGKRRAKSPAGVAVLLTMCTSSRRFAGRVSPGGGRQLPRWLGQWGGNSLSAAGRIEFCPPTRCPTDTAKNNGGRFDNQA